MLIMLIRLLIVKLLVLQTSRARKAQLRAQPGSFKQQRWGVHRDPVVYLSRVRYGVQASRRELFFFFLSEREGNNVTLWTCGGNISSFPCFLVYRVEDGIQIVKQMVFGHKEEKNAEKVQCW